MQILASFCLFVVFCNFIELFRRLFLQISIGFLVMECASRLKFLTRGIEFGGGFLVFGCFSQVFNVLGLFLMFGLGLKVLQSGLGLKGLMQFLCEFREKSSDLGNGFCLRDPNLRESDSKIVSCSCDSVELLEKLKSKDFVDSGCDLGNGFCSRDSNRKVCDSKIVSCSCDSVEFLEKSKSKDFLEAKGVLEECCESCEEDDEFDVLALRKLVKIQRQRANAALVEHEKERLAAASAADEAMAMIRRLQNQKSAVEIQANQYRRMAEQKQQYDQQVIQSLRWIVMKYESESSLLEDRLKQCTEAEETRELDQSEGDDSDTCLFDSFVDEGFDDVLISSLDYDTLAL